MDLLDAYHDPMFWWFPVGGTLVSLVAYLVFALPLTALARHAPAWAEPWRIQRRRADVDRWFWPGLRAWALNNTVLFALVLALWPLIQPWSGVHRGPPPAAWIVVGQVVLFTYLDDVLYWFLHRALHEGWLYRRIHSVHHRVPTPCAITGHYMHPVEFVLTGLLMLVGPLLLGVHVVTLYAWIAVRQLEAAEGHGGYQLPFSLFHLLPGGHGARFHDAHHARFHGNYSGFLGWFDGVTGTWSRGYAGRASEALR